MNGIVDRVHDALLLWENGRREGAFLSALIAFAATSKKRYRKQTDRGSFEQFLTDCSRSGRLSVEFRGELETVEHLFYKWLRCQLVHEAGLPHDIEIMDEKKQGWMSIRAGGGKPEYLLKVGSGWFHYLIGCVVDAPENEGLEFGLKQRVN